jgi:ribonuclease HI
MYFDGSLMKTGAGAGLLFISPLGKHLRYVLRLHFPASNNVAEYEALVNGLRIAIELGVWRLDARGDSQLVINQVMKNSHCRDRKMEAYCDEVRRLEDKFYGLELNHVARRYNETADELAKIASGRTTVPPDIFSRDIHQPSVKTDDTPEPEEASAQPEAPSDAEGEALRVEGERNGVTPNRNWQTPYLQYLHRGELPLDKAEARRLARCAKSFVLLGDEKELYHRSPSGILQRCISITEGQELLQEIHSRLAVSMQHLEPSSGTPSDKASTGRPRWPTPLGLYAPARGVNSTRDKRTCPLRPSDNTHHLVVCCMGSGPRRSLAEGTRGLLAPAGRHRQILQVDRGPTPNQHQVRAGGGVLHQHHPSLWGPELHHHRQWHPVHWEEVPGLLRGPPHPCGLGRRSSPHDEWAGRACQRYAFQGLKPRIYNDLNKFGKRWMKELPSVVWSLRTTPSRATGFSPFFLVYGAEAILPTDLEYGSPRTKAYDDQSNQTSREDSLDQLEEARDMALLHSARYQQSLRRYHARGVRSRDLQVGDLVLRLRQDARGRHKLTPPWEGPFIIAKILKPGTYKLANNQGEVYSNAWNIRQLRRFYP